MFRLRLIILVVLAVSASPAGGADSEWDFGDDTDQQAFEPGRSCAELAYLDDAELRYALGPQHTSDFYAFCRPEEPTLCSDYTSILRGYGSMTDGDDGFYCRFVPKKSADDRKRKA